MNQPTGATETKKKQRQRGFVFIASCLLSSSLVVYALSLYTHHIIQINTADRSNNRIAAFNMAEAGFSDGFAELTKGNISTFPHDISFTEIKPTGGYRVHLEDLGGDVYEITPEGFTPGQDASARSFESWRLDVRVKNGVISKTIHFGYSATADSTIDFAGGNGVSASYDSSVGPPDPVTNTDTNGDMLILHPDTADPDLGLHFIKGDHEIYGDAFLGTASTDPTLVNIDTHTDITGNRYMGTGNPADQSLFGEVYHQPYLPAFSGGSTLDVVDNDVTLGPGVYNFSEINIRNGKKLTISGDATIYVDGPVNISNEGTGQGIYADGDLKMYVNGQFGMYTGSKFEVGGSAQLYAQDGVINQGGQMESTSRRPQDLLVATQTGGVTVRQNASRLTGVIYAPEQQVWVQCGGCGGGGVVEGSIIAGSVLIDDSGSVYYDETLGDQPITVDVGYGYHIVSWRSEGPVPKDKV